MLIINHSVYYYLPFALVSSSLIGLKFNVPDEARATTISGDVIKAWVAGLSSFLPVKLRLKDVTIVFFFPFSISCLENKNAN